MRQCPVCMTRYSRLSRGSCPECKTGLHNFTIGKDKLTITETELEAIPDLLTLFEELASQKHGVNFKINHRNLNDEVKACKVVFVRLRELANENGITPSTIGMFRTFLKLVFTEKDFHFFSRSMYTLNVVTGTLFPRIGYEVLKLHEYTNNRTAIDNKIANDIATTNVEGYYAL